MGRDAEPIGHPELTVTTRLRDDMRAVSWSATDAEGKPLLVRVCRATALPAHVAAFKASALALKKLHDSGDIPGLLPVLSVSEDGHSYVTPALTMGTAFDVPVLAWELSQTMTFFLALAKTIKALNDAGHFLGRWSALDVLLDDELSPVLACDLDPKKSLPFDARERDFFAPEALKDEMVDARSDVYTLGKILELLVKDAQENLADAARKSSGFGSLVAIIALATSKAPSARQATVDALIDAVEGSIDMLPVGRADGDRFDLESVPPPKPAPKPAAQPIAPPSLDVFETPKESETAEPPTLSGRWIAIAFGLLAAVSAIAFFLDPSEGASIGLMWAAAILTTFGLVRAVARFPLRARVAVAFGTLILLLTFDPIGPASRAGIDRRLHGDRIAREKQLKSLIDRGRKSFPGKDLSEVSLAGANLSLADFSEGDLSRANFSRAKLGGIIVSHTNLSDAAFEGADLRDVDLSVATGWQTASCDGATRMPENWVCSGGHLAKAAVGAAP